jgi:succinoglycan biosynthesis transport protein ExoP
MTLIGFFRIIFRNLKWLVLFPMMLAGVVFYLTRNMPKEYQSSATVYTGLASGYSITDDGDEKVDYFKVNNAFDNLITTVKARETIEEVAIKLLAQHLLLKAPDVNILDEKRFNALHKLLNDAEIAKLVVPGSFNKTVIRLYSIKDSSNKNTVQYLLTDGSSPYAVSKILGSLTVMRKSTSDMLELGYKTDDAGVCLNTLKFLIEAFSNRYKNIKGSETLNVVKYFEDQLKEAFTTLQKSENRLRDFGVNNRIINYNEQSKFVAESKEDLSTDYYKEKMKFEAAQTALRRIEEKMSNYNEFVAANDELVKLRQELSTINYKITNAQIYNYEANIIQDLQIKAEKVKNDLSEKARDYYEFNNSIEWVPQNSLLTEWLTKVVELEEAKGRLMVYEQRLKQYDGIYKEFAPLGSTMNRLEREVGVQEKQYLSVLHGLNLARLRQQSLEMSNQLKTVDNPFFPLQPLPSKRGLLIMVSFLAGFILLLAYLVGSALLNRSIQSPEKVEKIVGLPMLSALPELTNIDDKGVKVKEVYSSLMQQIINTLFIDLKRVEPLAKSYLIIVFSTKGDEGKSFVAESLVNKLSRIRKKVLYLYPETSSEHGKYLEKDNPKLIKHSYAVNDGIIDYDGIQDFIKTQEGEPENLDDVSYNVLEIPRLNKYPLPANLIEQAHYSLLVVHAAKSWTSADQFLLKNYLKLAHGKTSVLLNHVAPDLLESIYGEIPKRRSFIRRKIKNLLGGEQY